MENVLRRLCEAVAAAERECGLDWRRSYSKLVPREAGSFELELSREEVLRALPRHLGGFSLERTLVQILVVVANIQMSHTTLKAEVEKGSM